jgi:hypothetical protein
MKGVTASQNLYAWGIGVLPHQESNPGIGTAVSDDVFCGLSTSFQRLPYEIWDMILDMIDDIKYVRGFLCVCKGAYEFKAKVYRKILSDHVVNIMAPTAMERVLYPYLASGWVSHPYTISDFPKWESHMGLPPYSVSLPLVKQNIVRHVDTLYWVSFDQPVRCVSIQVDYYHTVRLTDGTRVIPARERIWLCKDKKTGLPLGLLPYSMFHLIPGDIRATIGGTINKSCDYKWRGHITLGINNVKYVLGGQMLQYL